ncbi:hypothetical protein EON81_04245 [bacterium]|nr:MAG: hypothetical protein EON81_04245 [bacterium]
MASPIAEAFLRQRTKAISPEACPWPFEEDLAENGPVVAWKLVSSRDLSATGGLRCLTDLVYEVCVYRVGSNALAVSTEANAMDAALDRTFNVANDLGAIRTCNRVKDAEVSRPYVDRAGRTVQRLGARYRIRVSA